jgi:hypothetical protein
MSETDRVKDGEEAWKACAIKLAEDGAVDQLAAISKWEDDLARLRACTHEGEKDRVGANYIVCFECKWLMNWQTREWEPLGYKR